jgi:hypothetical protein
MVNVMLIENIFSFNTQERTLDKRDFEAGFSPIPATFLLAFLIMNNSTC